MDWVLLAGWINTTLLIWLGVSPVISKNWKHLGSLPIFALVYGVASGFYLALFYNQDFYLIVVTTGNVLVVALYLPELKSKINALTKPAGKKQCEIHQMHDDETASELSERIEALELVVITAALTASLSRKAFFTPAEAALYLGVDLDDIDRVLKHYRIKKILLLDCTQDYWVVSRADVESTIARHKLALVAEVSTVVKIRNNN